MERVLRLIIGSLPLIFAFGFLVPVIDQAMTALGWSAPFGLGTLTFAFILGGTLGIIAQIRGRWI